MTALMMVDPIKELESQQALVDRLMKLPHYQKMGVEGLFLVATKARAMNMCPLEALNGGMYSVKGKVEMSSAMMNQLIRQNGHSISKDKRSDDTICILHGKRADNGDTWTESFSIEEAKRAGLYAPNSTWTKYPRDMLFARALSRLARQLFADVIKGCYVHGEIALDLPHPEGRRFEVLETTCVKEEAPVVETIDQERLDDMKQGLQVFEDLNENVTKLVNDRFGGDWLKMPISTYESVMNRLRKKTEDEYIKTQLITEEVAHDV